MAVCNNDPIPKSNRNEALSNAVFKSQLFDALYERQKIAAQQANQVFTIEKYEVEMPIDNEDNHHVRVFTNQGNDANLNEFITRFLKRETPAQ